MDASKKNQQQKKWDEWGGSRGDKEKRKNTLLCANPPVRPIHLPPRWWFGRGLPRPPSDISRLSSRGEAGGGTGKGGGTSANQKRDYCNREFFLGLQRASNAFSQRGKGISEEEAARISEVEVGEKQQSIRPVWREWRVESGVQAREATTNEAAVEWGHSGTLRVRQRITFR